MNMNTNQTKLHTLGIDIGSTTVKVAILNEKNENYLHYGTEHG